MGIKDDLLIDRKIEDKFNPITKEIVLEMQELLYNRIYENVKKRKTLMDESIDCNLMLEFSINYKELINSIKENSLLYYKNITEKELDLCEKLDHGKFTSKDVESFNKIRNETKMRL